MSLPSVRTDICKEVFDENSAPSEEEVRDYALRIGINPDTESHLLHIAKDGLVRPLPEGWTPCYDKETKAFYYYNFASNETRWDHPLDDVYRDIVKKVKSESVSSTGEEDSKTSAKEDLRSFEDVTIPSEMLPKPLEPLRPMSSGGAVRKSNLQLAPLRKSPTPFSNIPDPPRSVAPAKKLSLPLTRSVAPSRAPIDLSLKRSASNTELGDGEQGAVTPLRSEPLRKKDALSPLQEKHPRSLHGHAELKLQGGGSMFLKSKQKASEDPDHDPDDGKSLEVLGSESRDLPRSILREGVSAKQLWEVDPSEEERQQWRRQEMEEDRKSVRFNLDKDPEIKFNMSDSEGNEELEEEMISEEQDTDEDRIIAGVKVSDILKKMNSVDNEEGSLKAHNMDDLETQVGKSSDRSVGRSTQSITNKLKDLYLPSGSVGGDFDLPHSNPAKLDAIQAEMFGGFLSPRLTEERGTFLKNIKLKTPQEIKEMSSGLSGKEGGAKDATKITEKRQLGSSLFRNDITSKSVENLVLNGDLDKSSLEFDLGNDSHLFDSGFDAEKTLESRRKVLEKSLKEIEVESNEKINDLREKLKEDETLERNRLELELEERMSDFKASLQEQQSTEETTLKQNMHLNVKQTSDTLFAEQAANLQTLRSDFEAKFNEERNRLELELKEKMESLKLDTEEMLKRVEEEQSNEKQRMTEEIVRKNRQEVEDLRNKLSAETESRKHLTVVEAQVSALTDEQTSKLTELQSCVSKAEDAHKETVDSLLRGHAQELDKLGTEHVESVELLQASHAARIQELTASHARAEEECKTEYEAAMTALREEQAAAMEACRNVHEREAVGVREGHEVAMEACRGVHEKEAAGVREGHEAAIEQLRTNHTLRLDTLRNESLREEEVIRREHLERLNELKARLESERQRLRSHSGDDKEASGPVFEKLRCEKRLLEDKYRTLKDKYVRLKGDVKMSVERRRKREHTANTTGSETERSTSHRATDRSAFSDCSHPPKNDNDKVTRKRPTDNNNGAGNKNATSPKNLLSQLPSEEVLQGVDSDNASSSSSKIAVEPAEHHRKRRQLFARLKSASTSHINNNVGSASDALRCSPVENLRRQLQKLDDLEDQFPAATHTDTYLRYPFSDPGQNGSSELEFFRHRIHLERDSVRRAKDFLQAQRDAFRSRQRQLKKRQADGCLPARAVIEQLADEERTLTDMEVSLHRTRGLLGEKIIRLRHLEQSLHRVATPKAAGDDAATLSDVSSHSGGSSGFSSIELPSDAVIGPGHVIPRNSHPYQEPTEIVHSLENLNAEIHDIWDVLNKSRPGVDVGPPFALPGGWLGMPPRPPPSSRRPHHAPPTIMAATQATLVERTKSLRDWLRQARIDSAELTSPGQATL